MTPTVIVDCEPPTESIWNFLVLEEQGENACIRGRLQQQCLSCRMCGDSVPLGNPLWFAVGVICVKVTHGHNHVYFRPNHAAQHL